MQEKDGKSKKKDFKFQTADNCVTDARKCQPSVCVRVEAEDIVNVQRKFCFHLSSLVIKK